MCEGSYATRHLGQNKHHALLPDPCAFFSAFAANRAAHKVSNLSPISRVHLVFDLCEEPHPRVDVPPGTVCDYDMEQGLLCQYPEGTRPVVMPPAHWVDAAAAAVESQGSNTAELQAQQVEDNGTGYFASDDPLVPTHTTINSVPQFTGAASALLPVEPHLQAAPAPEHQTAGSAGAQQHPESVNLLSGAAEGGASSVFGTVGNGQASTWVTAAMHPQSTMQFA